MFSNLWLWPSIDEGRALADSNGIPPEISVALTDSLRDFLFNEAFLTSTMATITPITTRLRIPITQTAITTGVT